MNNHDYPNLELPSDDAFAEWVEAKRGLLKACAPVYTQDALIAFARAAFHGGYVARGEGGS